MLLICALLHTDKDECSINSNLCSQHADCINKKVSEDAKGYKCVCHNGYEMDGDTCKGTLILLWLYTIGNLNIWF